jgi:hypothetical protein
MAMHLSDRMFETHLSTPISQTFALIAGDCNTTACRGCGAAAGIEFASSQPLSLKPLYGGPQSTCAVLVGCNA